MSRDMSAFTTLDNANMGTREDFEKWAAEEGRSIKRSNPDYAPKPYASAATNNALDGWNARQPEIDALKAENAELSKVKESALRERISLEIRIDALKEKHEKERDKYLENICWLQGEICKLKAENERLSRLVKEKN